MRRPQSESVLSLASLGARGEEEEAEDVDEVALAVETIAAAPLSRGFLRLMILVSIAAAAREGDATTEQRGLRAWAEAAAARGAGKDMISLSVEILFVRVIFFLFESPSDGSSSELSTASFDGGQQEEKAKERDALLVNMVTFDAELFGSRLGRLYSSWRVRDGFQKRSSEGERKKREHSIGGRAEQSMPLRLFSFLPLSRPQARASMVTCSTLTKLSSLSLSLCFYLSNQNKNRTSRAGLRQQPMAATLLLLRRLLRQRRSRSRRAPLRTSSATARRPRCTSGCSPTSCRVRRKRERRRGEERGEHSEGEGEIDCSLRAIIIVNNAPSLSLSLSHFPSKYKKNSQTPSWSSPRRSSTSSPRRKRPRSWSP